MNFLRIVGYIGIALLVPIMLFGLMTALSTRDWYGALLMLGFAVLLLFFTHSLRAAARRESNPALKAVSGLGWHGESLSTLFYGPVLHTPEGLLMLAGSLLALLFAALSFLSWISLTAGHTALFTLWPIILFLVFIRFCSPQFKPRIYSSLMILIWAALPFYVAFS